MFVPSSRSLWRRLVSSRKRVLLSTGEREATYPVPVLLQNYCPNHSEIKVKMTEKNEIKLSIQTWIAPVKKKRKRKAETSEISEDLVSGVSLVSRQLPLTLTRHGTWPLNYKSPNQFPCHFNYQGNNLEGYHAEGNEKMQTGDGCGERELIRDRMEERLYTIIIPSLAFASKPHKKHILNVGILISGPCPSLLDPFTLFPIPAGASDTYEAETAWNWLHSKGLVEENNEDLLSVTFSSTTIMIDTTFFQTICNFTKLAFMTLLGERSVQGLNGSEWCMHLVPLEPPTNPPTENSLGGTTPDATMYEINHALLSKVDLWCVNNFGKCTPSPLGTVLDALSTDLYSPDPKRFYSLPFIQNGQFTETRVDVEKQKLTCSIERCRAPAVDGLCAFHNFERVQKEEKAKRDAVRVVQDVEDGEIGEIVDIYRENDSSVSRENGAHQNGEQIQNDAVEMEVDETDKKQKQTVCIRMDCKRMATHGIDIAEYCGFHAFEMGQKDGLVRVLIVEAIVEEPKEEDPKPASQAFFSVPLMNIDGASLHSSEMIDSRCPTDWIIVDRLAFNRTFIVNSMTLPPRCLKREDEEGWIYMHPPKNSAVAATLISYTRRKFPPTDPVAFQPIIHCHRMTTNLDFLHTNIVGEVQEGYTIHSLLPQFCGLHPWTIGVLMEMKWIPTICYMLESRFVSRDFGAKWFGGMWKSALKMESWPVTECIPEDFRPIATPVTPIALDALESPKNAAIPEVIQQPPKPSPETPSVHIDALDMVSSLMNEALTTPSAALGYNYETLETVGDTMLKMVTSIFLYCVRPAWSDGTLSRARQSMIQNCTLVKYGRVMGNGMYMNGSVFSRRAWWPPRWQLGEGIHPDDLPWETVPDVPTSHGISKFAQQWIKTTRIGNKMLADSVESVVGAIGMSLGMDTLMLILPVLANLVTERNELASLEDTFSPKDFHLLKELTECWGNFSYPTVKMPWTFEDSDPLEILVPHVPLGQWEWNMLSSVQAAIGYTFCRPEILVSALVHSTYTGYTQTAFKGGIGSLGRDWVSPCPVTYERLEFLGDAILDHVIMQYWIEKYPTLPPQQLTHLRAASVNNHFLVLVAVELGLHRWLRIGDASVQFEVDDIVRILVEEDGIDVWRMGRGRDFWTDLDPPKALGDCLEAVLGAVFLDSRFDIPTLTNLITKKLIEPWISGVLTPATVEKHPVSMMFEWFAMCNDWKFEVESTKRPVGQYSEPRFEARVRVHGSVIVCARARGKQTARRLCAKAFIEMVEKDSVDIQGMTFIVDEDLITTTQGDLVFDAKIAKEHVVKKPDVINATRAVFAKRDGNSHASLDEGLIPGSWAGGMGQVRAADAEYGEKRDGVCIPVRIRWGCTCEDPMDTETVNEQAVEEPIIANRETEGGEEENEVLLYRSKFSLQSGLDCSRK